ncbi:CHAT domain-containing protein [Suillus americanus]|nr:CHAT domain-containing protein [Suillus americanus]
MTSTLNLFFSPSQLNSINSPHIPTPVFPSHSFRPPLSPSSILVILLHPTIMPSSSESRYIRLKVINGKNLQVPSMRIPASIYVTINVDSTRRWKSALKVLSSKRLVAWGDAVTLSSRASPAFSVEIRASYEADRMLGGGEAIGKLKMSWDELLNHGGEPFDLHFPPVRGVHPSLTLKAVVIHTCDNQNDALSESLVDCQIARDTDAGHARLAKYVTRETVSHLNHAIQRFQLVLEQCPISHPDHAAALTNLAWARLKGYIRNDLQDIDATTSLFRDALALRPQRHPDHPLSLYNLTEALNWRHDKQSTTADIREAAHLYHELLPLCPEGTYLRSIAAGENGVDYVIDGCNNLPIDASDEGIRLQRVVLELCPLGHQLRHHALRWLAFAMDARFKQCGNIDDIDETIQLRREAVSMCPRGHAYCDTYLNNLASSLLSRFDHQGKPNDLDEAIYLYEALCRFPVEHESRDSFLDNLGLALIARFNEHGDIDDITRAVSLFREALTLRPPGHSHRDTTLNNLALALETSCDNLYVSEDLNEAIDRYRESLLLTRLGDPERYVNLFNLSSALCSRFTHNRDNEDVEEAITLCQESLAALSSLHPDRYFSYMRLLGAYLSRYQILHNPADLSLATENFRLASRHPTQGFPQRIQVAISWACQAEIYQHESALEAYQTCFELFDGHVMTRSSIISRREAATAFDGAQSLPVDAASCAIRSGNLRQAVELAEQGRGQQWSLASRLRTSVEDLVSANPTLARNYLELSKLVSDAAQNSATITNRAAADRAATEYRRLTRQWEAAVAEIRDLRAFSRFLLPPLYEDLQAAARQGPVIILIASQYSCSAIIIPTSGDPHHIPLPSISLAELTNLKDRFARAIRHASGMGPKLPRNDLIVLLRTVWNEIMLPIVNVLQQDLTLKLHSRIWLCPTAAFTSIPLHAAHPFKTNADGSKEPCLEDLYICSYTPTLSALVRSRQMMKRRVTPSFVTIGQGTPGAGKGKALLAVDSELELVHKLVPATANHTTISGDAATRAGALDALQQNTWVHLACHGKQDRTQPYHSHFVMRDEHLTLLDIMERDIPRAEFAFLSACHTAVGDEVTPDEVIHLAAGLQFSGFKSVVGTLWEVDDAVAKHVVEAFYKNLFKDLEDGDVMDCTKAAWALNRATHSFYVVVCYLVFVYSAVFLSTRMFIKALAYSTRLWPRLLLECLDSMSRTTQADSRHTGHPSFRLQAFKSFCTMEPRLTTASVINAKLKAGLV